MLIALPQSFYSLTTVQTLPHISHLLLSGLSTEKSAHNTELLLWYIPVFLKELAAAVRAGTGTPVAPSDFAVGAVEVIVSSICSSVWNHDVSQAACRVLSAVSRVFILSIVHLCVCLTLYVRCMPHCLMVLISDSHSQSLCASLQSIVLE